LQREYDGRICTEGGGRKKKKGREGKQGFGYNKTM